MPGSSVVAPAVLFYPNLPYVTLRCNHEALPCSGVGETIRHLTDMDSGITLFCANDMRITR